MADIGTGLKNFWLKSMEVIGNTASNIASNTKSKVDEMNLVNRRAEILKEFGSQAYALFLKGERFPKELEAQLRELTKLDNQLNDLRAERLAGVKAAENTAEEAADEAAPAADEVPDDAEEAFSETAGEEENGFGNDPDAEESVAETSEAESEAEGPETGAAAEDQAVPVIQVIQEEAESGKTSSLSSAINDLFESAPAKEASEKVSGALDSLEDSLKKFSAEMDRKVDAIAEKLSE